MSETGTDMTFSFLGQRRAGILLHLTSLPGGDLQGGMGADAYRFVDFLAAAGMTLWQVLPVGPVSPGESPYQSESVHAGNPLLIDLHDLAGKGWIKADSLRSAGNHPNHIKKLLAGALIRFERSASEEDKTQYAGFKTEQSYWLDSYATYQAIKDLQQGKSWWQWPADLREGNPGALTRLRAENMPIVEQSCFEQFIFFRQWQRLRTYARQKGIFLVGDVPYYAAHDSADVWSHRSYFRTDSDGQAEFVAGVPPDDFSATGQRWGNPVYDWDRVAADGFTWWIERIRTCLQLFDIVRLDHFRGFESCWQIPSDCPTAEQGAWVPVPGRELLAKLQERYPSLPFIAEDLGTITPEVELLRDRFQLAGLKVLQFAFDSDSNNPYLLHNHVKNSLVCTGTHDNNTTLGWFDALDNQTRQRVVDYLGKPGEPMPWPLIRSALASVAQLAVIPMQDLLSLGADHRMNIPGTAEGNWSWRFDWQQVHPDLSVRLRSILGSYDRLPAA
jgi:4-alpha-glucanotransferase